MTPSHRASSFGIEPLFVPIPEAGQALGIKRSTVYRLLDEGSLKGTKLGSRRLVSVASIRELAAKLVAE
jgi:excisionase family DNA binding protein